MLTKLLSLQQAPDPYRLRRGAATLLMVLALLVGVGELSGLRTSAQRSHPFCASDELLSRSLRQNPALQRKMNEQETAIRNYVESQRSKRIQQQSATSNLIIPVVVYVVHNNGPENISDQQVNSQIAALNNAFSGQGVQFCLATKEGSSQFTGSTPGIIRIASGFTNHLTSQESQLKALSTLPGDRYLRIWVVKDIDNHSGVVGYARFPGSVSLALEGIVMRHDVFGDAATCGVGCSNLVTNYDQGKVLAHEVGHYLNLYHTFHGGCTGLLADCATNGDMVCDTPQIAAPNTGCPSSATSCTAASALITNHMDYTNDLCRNGFTTDQGSRMLAAINTLRPLLVSPQNLVYTGVQCAGFLNASFAIDNPNACTNQTVTFDALDTSGATYAWDFGDGATGNTDPATHSYSTAGTHTVTLTATSGGNSVSSTQQVFVTACAPINSSQGNWFFGTFGELHFNTGMALPGNAALTNNTINTSEACITQSDSSGNLLFYSDGRRLWNKLHTLVNGGNLFDGGNDPTQALAVPDPADPNPGNPNSFYLISMRGYTAGNNTNGNFTFTKVSANGSNVTFSAVNTPIAPPVGADNNIGEMVTTVPACGNNYWIVVHGSYQDTNPALRQALFVYPLTGAGIGVPTVYPIAGGAYFGQLKASPDGTRIAYGTGDPRSADGSNSGYAHVLDFDRNTGTVSNPRVINRYVYGVSFSPNSQLLYLTDSVSGPVKILQYDLNAANINASERLVAEVPAPYPALQLGPDNKIYVALHGHTHLAVINYPDQRNTGIDPNACGYSFNGPFLNIPSSGTSVGSRYGLPNMIDARKASASPVPANFSYGISSCSTVNFLVPACASSYSWSFGDSVTSTVQNPAHTYAANGTYTVTLNLNGATTVTHTITIGIPASSANIFGPSQVCLGSGNPPLYNYSANAQLGLIYSWTVTGGAISGVSNSDNVDVVWNALPGTVQLTVSDPATGCSTSKSLIVTQGCPASISGLKFNDLNGNGVRDTGEPGLANWTIKVTDSNGNTQTTITDSQGNYSFTVPAPGTYSVSELLQSGWTQTVPSTGTYFEIVSPGQVVNNRNFGNELPGACATPPPGMVAWWPLDETMWATTVTDIIGANNGAPQPGPLGPIGPSTSGPLPGIYSGVTPPARVGGSLYFYANHFVRVPNASAPSLNFGAGDFTIDAWVYAIPMGPTLVQPIADKLELVSSPAGGIGYRLFIRNGQLHFILLDGLTAVDTQAPITPGQWRHVAVVRKGGAPNTVEVYIGGQLVSSSTPVVSSISNSVDLLIGGIVNSPGIGGLPSSIVYGNIAIDELEIFKRGLNQTEIQAIFNAKSAGKCRATGSLTVTKTVTNLWALPFPVGTNFPVTISCLPSVPNVTLNLAAGGTQTVNNIPVGSTCTVTEGALPSPIADPACASLGWGTPTYAPGQTVTIPITGGSQTVTVTNTYLCNTGPACASLPANMVSWWPLNEQEGATIVTDIKGGHNGTPSGSLVGWNALAAKVGGRALSVGDNVSVPDDASLRFGTGNFSVDAWFGVGEPKFIGGIVDKLDITAKKGYALYVQNDHLKLVMGDGKALVTYTSAAPVGIVFGTMAWHHVAVTVDRSSGLSTFYIDGKSAGTFTALPSTSNIATTSALLIGGSRLSTKYICACEYFLDEVEIFNDVVSASDIRAIFDAGSAGKCTATIKGKKFNDLNQNGVLDASEQGLRGWTIQVTDRAGKAQSATTDAEGNYSFTVPAHGTYTLSEVKQDGWFPTTSARTITVAANETADVNFGNIKVRNGGYTFLRGMNEFCIWGGAGPFNSPRQIDNPNPQTPIRNTGGVRFGALGLCYGRILWANDRFAFKYTFNAIPVAVLSYPDINPNLGFPVPISETRRNVFGAGLSPIGFQLYFRPQSRIKPFINTSGGFIFFKDPVPRLNGAQFNFTYDFGGGVQVFRDSRRAFTLGYKYQHLSNGGRALNNPGFDGHVFYFGYSIFKARKIAQGP